MNTSAKIKGLLLVAISIFFTANVKAQDTSILGDPKNYDQGFKLGLGIDGGYVTDNLYDWSLGADVRLQYDFSKKTSVTLTTGFTNMFIGNGVKDLGFIPVKGGFKIFWLQDEWYALAEVGAGFPVTNGYSGQVDNTLILSPGIGYATKYVDLSLRYEHYSDFPTEDGGTGVGQIALRLAYGFRL
jgi:hypothetical protein